MKNTRDAAPGDEEEENDREGESMEMVMMIAQCLAYM